MFSIFRLANLYRPAQSLFEQVFSRLDSVSVLPITALDFGMHPFWARFGSAAVASDRSIRISVRLGSSGVHLAFSSREWTPSRWSACSPASISHGMTNERLVAYFDDDLYELFSFWKFHRDLLDFDINSPFLGLRSFA